MDICNKLCYLAIWQTVLCGKTFDVGHYMYTIQPNSFIPAVHIDITDFYYFVPLSENLTLA